MSPFLPALGFGEHGEGLHSHRARRKRAAHSPSGAFDQEALLGNGGTRAVRFPSSEIRQPIISIMEPLTLGIAGLGTVGGGLLELLQANGRSLRKYRRPRDSRHGHFGA